MTNINERNDYNRPDDNLDRLIGLGEPLPRMPETLKARIRSKLAEVGQKSEKKNFLLRHWAIVSPLATAAILSLFLIFFWPGGPPGTISWADVQNRIDQIHTLTARSYKEITTTEGKQIIKRSKIYIKDPGLFKVEYYSPDADIDAVTPGPDRIFINKLESGKSEQLTLFPSSHSAERVTQFFHTNSSKPIPSQEAINLASENWKAMKQITADKTKRIGNREINGVPASGFEFYTPYQDFYIPSDKSAGPAHIRIWASLEDAVPLLIEVEFQNTQGQKIRIECSDIQWSVSMEDSLFDFSVPTGWHLSQARSELAAYAKLAPGVSLQIGLEGQEPLATADDVAMVVLASQTTHPGLNIPSEMWITIELKPETAQRLHVYANAHPQQLIIVNFNGQIRAAAELNSISFTQLSFDISLLRLSLAQLEERYLTPTIERNKS